MYYIAVIDCKFIEYWHQRQQWRTRSSDRSLGARLFSFSFSSFSVYFMMQATQNRIINFFLGEYCLTLPCDCVKDFFPLINLCIMIRSRLIMLCKLLNLQCRTGRICMWFSGGFAGLLLRCIKCGKAELIHHSPSFIHDIPSAVVYCLAGRALAKRWVDYMLIKSFMRSWIWLRNRLKA
mgnify:FL=1